MREDAWGPRCLPFHDDAVPFATQGFEEALARLLFIAERRWPAGLLVGPAGCGKTALLKSVRSELRRSGVEAVSISLSGIDGDEFWPTIASALGSHDVEEGLTARKTVRALLVASAMINRPVTLLLDDVDRGGLGLVDQVAALVRLAEGVTPNHTIIIASSRELPNADLTHRIDLRAELHPFSKEQSVEYVIHRLQQAQSNLEFASNADEELFSATGGVPAAIDHVVDLAIVATHASDTRVITADMIRTAASELRPAGRPPADLTAVERRFTQHSA